MQFKEIVGQEFLKNKLIGTVRDQRISHAQLFLGKLGYGSLPLALAYAQYINCLDPQEKDSCGTCSSCIKINNLAHPDLHFSFPVSTNKSITKNPACNDFAKEWREISLDNPYFDLHQWQEKIDIDNKQSIINVNESQEIIKKLSLKSYEGKYKILIIWKAELLNNQAANKLLKIIEEPTAKTILLLLAEEEEKLLKTITSRTQLIKITAIESSKIESALIQRYATNQKKATNVALLSEGDWINAVQRIEKADEDELFFDLFKKWMRACYEADVVKIIGWVEEISTKEMGRENQKRFLEFAIELMREATMKNYTKGLLSRLGGKEEKFLANFSPFIHENNLIQIVEVLNEAHYHISRNAYAKILFTDVSMKFANLLRVKKRTFAS